MVTVLAMEGPVGLLVIHNLGTELSDKVLCCHILWCFLLAGRMANALPSCKEASGRKHKKEKSAKKQKRINFMIQTGTLLTAALK